MNLENKFGVVTGAGKGIGAAIVQRLLNDGIAGIAMVDVDLPLLIETSKKMDPQGKRTLPIQCDVSVKADVENAFKAIVGCFGRIDILVNNAGITRDIMFHKMSDDQWKAVIDVHLYGTYYCTQQVIPGMRAQEYGKIVNLASTSAFGNVGQANYSAAKAGIIGFTKTLARESARKNITVNCIAPGFIHTDIIKTVPAEIMKANLAALPGGRLGEPEEVAALAAFLCCDESSFVSGECIVCAGAAYT